jgi:septal ring factor EnvC (AmiA/AmiB activator)
MDIVVRNLRIAGKRDVVGLARQLARTEDKLERVLQEVEELRDELTRAKPEADSDGRNARARPARRAAATRSKDSS